MTVTKYEHDKDGSEYNEEDIIDVARENITLDDLETAFTYFCFEWLLQHLTDCGQTDLYNKALEIYLEEHFSAIEVEEDE